MRVGFGTEFVSSRLACSQWSVYIDDHETISCNCPCNCLSSVVLRFATRCEWGAMCADMLEQRLNTRMASVTFLTKGNRCKRKPLTFSEAKNMKAVLCCVAYDVSHGSS